VNTDDTVRRADPGTYRRLQLPVISSVSLPAPNPSTSTFVEALDRRKSGDYFTPPSLGDLSNFLNDVYRIRATNQSDANRQKRCVPSMGALHPAHLLLCLHEHDWYVYAPEKHSLDRLPIVQESSKTLHQLVEEHSPEHGGVIVCLLSDCDLASNYYDNYLPLLFRDAGVLLGHAALVAAAHDFSFRILGRTGTYVAESLVVGIPFKPLATGLALLGAQI
jgi:hypothetical protein